MPAIICRLTVLFVGYSVLNNLSSFAESPTVSKTDKGSLVFEDDFERPALGDKWRVAIGDFHSEDGLLIGNERLEDKHGAVVRAITKIKNGTIEYSFRMNQVKTFNFVIDQKGFKETHAGHLCRVVVQASNLRISDDKEGAMRNDIFEMKNDPAKKAEVAKLLKDRSANFKVKFDPLAWHKMTIEIVDDQLSVSLDDQFVGSLKSPGIAHDSKTDIGFTVIGQGAEFDNFRIWEKK